VQVKLRHLRAFCAVAEELNFRRASERLGIAQPALSRTIQHLEELCGVLLLERTTRVICLTEPGKAFFSRAKAILTELDDAVRIAQRVQKGIAGEIRVGFNDFAISGLLPEMVRNFRALNPDIDVGLVDSNSPEMIDMVLDGRIEVAFHNAPGEHEDLDSIVARSEQLVCVLPASHRLARQKTIAVAELADEPFVIGRWENWSVFYRIVRDFCRRHGFEPRIFQEAEHSDGIMGFVAAEMGVTLYVDTEVLHVLRGIVVRPLREELPKIDSLASWRRDRRFKMPALDRFISVATEVVERNGVMFRSPPSG